MFSKEYFKNYNYKKHAKLCAGIYGVLFAFDMTISYFILKSAFGKMEEQGLLDEDLRIDYDIRDLGEVEAILAKL